MQELIADLPPALAKHASWLVNAGAEDTRSSLMNMTGSLDEIRILQAAISTEKSKQARPSRLKPMEAKLRKFSAAATAATMELIQAKNSKSSASDVEIVTEAEVTRADLRASAERINNTIELLKGHEAAFEDATLEHRLCIGLEIAKAQQAFGLTKAEAGAIGGSKSTVNLLPENPEAAAKSEILAHRGFTNWIKTEIPELPRPTAIRYSKAFASLGITTDATPARIKAKLKDLNHHSDKNNLPRPSLASLVKQAPKATRPDGPLKIEAPKDSAQIRLEDAREAFHLWKEKFETMLGRGQLDDLDRKGLEDLKEFIAGVRDRLTTRLRKS